ncbi:MAG: hypothetical protein JXR46_09410 [Calditrichaceae bacterium]|nr:hypothetical protein [Calditrichaceae bacterium]MBN2709249.1 hypothetical protein [Calditrichaceae bacterium]RQV96202.1 MAG: hypothetical protein EH224_05720 [Calditrichota bacterium]
MRTNTASTIFQSRGNIELLSRDKIILLASQNPPPSIEETAVQFFRLLKKQPITMACGWQSKLEKVLFKLAETGDKAAYIHYLARNINTFSPDAHQQKLIDHNKLLVLAPEISEDRPVSYLVDRRDQLMFNQINKILLLYVRQDGRLDQYLKTGMFSTHQLYILDHQEHEKFYKGDMVVLNTHDINHLI